MLDTHLIFPEQLIYTNGFQIFSKFSNVGKKIMQLYNSSIYTVFKLSLKLF